MKGKKKLSIRKYRDRTDKNKIRVCNFDRPTGEFIDTADDCV